MTLLVRDGLRHGRLLLTVRFKAVHTKPLYPLSTKFVNPVPAALSLGSAVARLTLTRCKSGDGGSTLNQGINVCDALPDLVLFVYPELCIR